MLWGKEGKTDHITIKEYVYEYDRYEIIQYIRYQVIEFILKDCLYNLIMTRARAEQVRLDRSDITASQKSEGADGTI